MKSITLITDYKGNFGSKYFTIPYRSGMNKQSLEKYFYDYGYNTTFIKPNEIDFRNNFYAGQLFLYTSQEDIGRFYKSYIEDIVLGLELQNAILVPSYKYLKMHENKVFLEIFRSSTNIASINNIQSFTFGCLEELLDFEYKYEYPVVVKKSAGAMSKGVYLAKSRYELIKYSKKVSRSKHFFTDIKDAIRVIKHHGYKKESKHRNKFVVQQFIPNLNNDWKILIYWDKYYILYRGVRNNDFRASGSGRFIFDNEELIPDGIFDFAENAFNSLNVPNASFDICYDGKNFYLTELQLICFGTSTIEKADSYYIKVENDKWKKIIEKIELEKVYVESIINYINKNKLN